MFAIADVNNCYASCERLFQPQLRYKPVIVLSNNDGCVIARSNESKALNIKMGVPAYQIIDFIEQKDIAVFSSNYNLYGDMSTRVMTTLAEFTPDQEIYSIDESFLGLNGFEHLGLKEYGEKIVQTVGRDIGLPISLGISKTKTLSKVANKFAKKHKGYNGVCLIDTDEKIIKALQLTDISDVWGVGRKLTARMNKHGMKTAYDITQTTRAFMRKYYTVTGERLWMELQGVKCYNLEENPPDKKQICTSRAFGEYIETLSEMKEAVSTYAALCAQELRMQKTYACSLMVYIHTNKFNKTHDQYTQNCVIKLPVYTNSNQEIIKHALRALEYIFIPGFKYKKAGVIITEISKKIQSNVYYKVDYEKQARLMKVIDKYNRGFLNEQIKLAVQGTGGRDWKLKQERLSPRYTTRIEDVMHINCRI